jgi:RimJ/RimL family protein N-acetyltransferase
VDSGCHASRVDIVTERLTLRPLSPAEARRIVERAPEADDRWHAEYPFEDELDPLRALADASAPDPFFTLYAIRTSDDGVAIGGIGFFGPPDEDGSVELGYGLVEAVRGRGFATEALAALTRHALSNGARRVRADTAVDNLPSQRVLAKAGFSEVSRSGGLIFSAFG